MTIDALYSFAFRGLLTEEALDRSGRQQATHFEIDLANTASLVGLNALDDESVLIARNMSVVYTAIHAFENSVRQLIENTLLEEVGEDWWASSVSNKVRTSAENRIADEQKTRWHGQRGEEPLHYTMLPDLLKIIRGNQEIFEPFIPNVEWAAQIFEGVERSRNVIMHSEVLSDRDIARVGSLLKDWNAQVGA